MAQRAPKQWCLTKNETITSFESWRQNLLYILSLDNNFAPFLVAGTVWQKKLRNNPLRGFTNDAAAVVGGRTAAQKVAHLELMLGQIANFCPIISRNTIIKNSTSLDQIWQSVRAHFGFQSTGAHFLDLATIKLKPDERPEDLYQRLMAFFEDNLLLTTSGLTHHGDVPDEDEELSPTMENTIVLLWLQLIHRDLPALVKQRYGPELRSRTLASLKPEISQALDTPLDTLRTTEDAKIMRASSSYYNSNRSAPSIPHRTKQNHQTTNNKLCPICKASGRPSNHYLSRCNYLPEGDRKFLTRARSIAAVDVDDLSDNLSSTEMIPDDMPAVKLSSSRRVKVKRSPYAMMYYNHHPVKVTLDTGAEIDLIKASTAKLLGVPISKSDQMAVQADGQSPMNVIGETKISFKRHQQTFELEALVVEDLDVDILAGIPFMSVNDIMVRPHTREVIFSDQSTFVYNADGCLADSPVTIKRATVHLLRSPATTVWPGEYIELPLPAELADSDVAIEPRVEYLKCSETVWPAPDVITPVAGRIRIPNLTDIPQVLRKSQHFAQVLALTSPTALPHDQAATVSSRQSQPSCLQQITVDEDCLLPSDIRAKFINLHKEHQAVFSPTIKCYNGAVGPIEGVVNMGPVQPPQRKGRLPLYARDKLVELQQKFDELEASGVFAKPEDLGITAEYLNPSFLVKKPSGGYRLVTSFGEVGRYAKPQPALMPDVNTTLQTISQWSYLIKTDLSQAFFQIPLSKDSWKYCGVATPFKGIRVYTRTAMGMPGSETALEELMSRVLGHLIQEGVVAKIADDLYCGGHTPTELYDSWSRVLAALQSCGLVLSAPKTVIAPKSTLILGWVWNQGQLQASPHRIATLSTCERPNTVKALRSFLGAYKFLARVIPNCSSILSPLEAIVAGKPSSDTINWTTATDEAFRQAQQHLSDHRTVTLPKRGDQLWLVTDGAVKNHGIASTLYVGRNNQIFLASHFSAKLKERQACWLPCEVEALCIAASIRHFSPYIVQSEKPTCVLTDSQPCVEAYKRLMRGCFSNSSRVTTFLSVASRFAVTIQHLAGKSNVPSDFGSRNAPACNDARCQICSFVDDLQQASVSRIRVEDIASGKVRLPFTTRSTWLATQTECADLRRAHAHLTQGTRPSKKLTNIRDVKRYLQLCTIAKDGMLVVIRNEPFTPSQERIVVPRHVLQGLLTALHIRLDHPSQFQLKQVFVRFFYALDLDAALTTLYGNCHTCFSLQKMSRVSPPEVTSEPPTAIGVTFAADVLRRNRQFILIVRETVTSYTRALLIDGEDHVTLRNALLQICVDMCPLSGPSSVIRCDPAPGFTALANDDVLLQQGITLDIGRIKNTNKNPIAEKAVQELEDELLRCDPDQPTLTGATLAIAVARLNSRLRHQGLSARELWTQRDQFNHKQLPLDDRRVILEQHDRRQSSNLRRNKTDRVDNEETVKEGDLVYLVNERTKHQPRPRYIVVRAEPPWYFIRKFVGNQIRSNTYKVHHAEIKPIPSMPTTLPRRHIDETEPDDQDDSTSFPDTPTNDHVVEVAPAVGEPTVPRPPAVLTDPPTLAPMPATARHPPEVLTDPPTLAPVPAELPRRSSRERHTPKRFEDYEMSFE